MSNDYNSKGCFFSNRVNPAYYPESSDFHPLALICALSCSVMVTPRTVAHQAPLSMEFPKQEYRSRLPFPPPRDLPDPGIKPVSPALAGRFITTVPPGKLRNMEVGILSLLQLFIQFYFLSFSSKRIKRSAQCKLKYRLVSANFSSYMKYFTEFK